MKFYINRIFYKAHTLNNLLLSNLIKCYGKSIPTYLNLNNIYKCNIKKVLIKNWLFQEHACKNINSLVSSRIT